MNGRMNGLGWLKGLDINSRLGPSNQALCIRYFEKSGFWVLSSCAWCFTLCFSTQKLVLENNQISPVGDLIGIHATEIPCVTIFSGIIYFWELVVCMIANSNAEWNCFSVDGRAFWLQASFYRGRRGEGEGSWCHVYRDKCKSRVQRKGLLLAWILFLVLSVS